MPMIEGKFCICSTEYGDKLIFKRPDGALGGIASMHVQRHQLEVYSFFSHVLFDQGGGFIVEFLEWWSKSAFAESLM
jgi:hypothetical protein